MMDELNTNKIKIQEVIKTGNKLKDKNFCFTGSLKNFKSRDKAHEFVIKNGGTIRKGISDDLLYLVTNFDTPTKKYLKAQSQENTQIISEEEFLKMIE